MGTLQLGAYKSTGGGGGGSSLAEVLFTDDSGAYYVRVDNGTTVSFQTPTGSPATPGSGLRPVMGSGKQLTVATYDVLTAGTGYSLGDIIIRFLILDISAASPTPTSIWFNSTSGSVIATPTLANLQIQAESISSVIADGADATQGAKADSVASTDTGTFSLIALVKRLLTQFAVLLLGNSAPSTITGAYASAAAIDLITGNSTAGNPANSWTDVTGWDYALMTIMTDASGSAITVLLEGTNDTTNDPAGSGILAMDPSSTSFAASQTTASALGASAFARRIAGLGYKYIRLRVSLLTAGQVRATLQLRRGVLPIMMANVLGAPTTVTNAGLSATTNGVSTFHHLISAATTNATSVKGSAGSIAFGSISNNGAGVAYFKLYNKASAPTVGTDTPILTLLVPVNGSVPIPSYIYARLSTGLAYAITGGMAVSDTTAVAVSQVSVHLAYA